MLITPLKKHLRACVGTGTGTRALGPWALEHLGALGGALGKHLPRHGLDMQGMVARPGLARQCGVAPSLARQVVALPGLARQCGSSSKLSEASGRSSKLSEARRADIEGSKSNVAMNAWLPQASYPCGNFSDTSSFKFRRPRRAVPSPSPGRHATTRSRRGCNSSSPPTADGFRTGTLVPSPQSQSFSRSYGSILPTSLAYIVPSTRGCSPWRPDAVMSTTGRERHSVLRIFKGRRGRTGHHATCGALPTAGPYLRLNLSPLRPSKFSFEYLLLPPRSAPTAAPPRLAPKVLQRPLRPPTHRGLALAPMAGYRSRA
ncbi:hypothetical protein Vadar_014079 [Vaccinium darrowii]|uniref:Uncharacterized protein n=1 Tax=Vaccinium darrowii TaxID=229202 RepID=A0ACB7XA59_9ERIC|nr:hypothetical protein Vadar_014079 [Vaccinium darrowii]